MATAKKEVKMLIKALGDKEVLVRKAAAEALGKIGEPAVEPLITALGNEDISVRSAAVDALGKIGDVRAVAPLIKALGDEESSVRMAAAEVLGETKSEESLKILLKYVKKRERCAVKEIAYESIEKLCPIAGDKLRAEILSFMNEELNSDTISKGFRGMSAPGEELLKKHIAIANILAFFKDRDSIDPLLIRYGTHYANIRPLSWKQYTKPIIEAILKIAGNNKDDAFMKALAEWKCDPKWSEGDVISGGWKIKINTQSLNVVFSSLLACTEDLKSLEFFLKNGAFNKNLIKDHAYGYPIVNVKRKDVAITPEEKEAYDKVVKNTSKENIANLIKIMLDSTHPIYKSYYKNMGGDDPRKFLLDDDPSMQLMGIAMAKGVGYPKGIQDFLLDLALFSKEEAVRESALEGVKNAGIENIPFPKLKDLASENIQLIRKKNKNKTIASAIISMGDSRGLEYLQEIFKNSNKKTANSIIDGVLTFLDEEECIIFYDGLLKELCYLNVPHRYKAQYMKRWLDKTSIFRLRLPYGLPRKVIEMRAEGGRLDSIFSGYAKTEVSEKQNVIFKFVFQMSFEIAFCMISRDADEIKEKIPSMDKFVKKNIKNSYKLDDITTLKNLEKFLLSNFTATENKIQLDRRHDNSRPIHKCMRIAAARCLGIIYSSYKEHRERISKMVDPFREDKSPLIQKALKPIK